ncbi:efflux RND transporter periplasmic adaptor subunit [Salinisphaera sp. RV14]|uniref:efflux RND transporter periplasmic adaptor subunit n=1 Tax=Salinisphaera sp. RV14 TaxID=3454140 RepID=UPI003F86D001
MSMLARPMVGFRAARLLGLAALLCCAPAWSAPPGTVTAQSRTVTRDLTAYAEVVPIAQARLQSAQTGQIAGLNIDPGQHVTAGAALGKLKGPEIQALLEQRRTAVATAKAKLGAARHTLAITQKKRAAHLSTRQDLYNAQAALAQARAQLSAAQAAFQAVKKNAVLRAPATGTVTAVAVANGERVAAGQTVLTVQPTHGLWLKAIYYGARAAAVHVGMQGQFMPADGGKPIPVRVARILAVADADGGRPVGLRSPAKNNRWISGEAGTVVLSGAHETGVMVPTRALILYRTHWWVLIKTPKGDRRQRVTLGPSRGDDTLITRGLSAGTRVVVDHAYLTFHRHFSQHYQKPG